METTSHKAAKVGSQLLITDDTTFSILRYLSVSDLLVFAEVSKACKINSYHEALWNEMFISTARLSQLDIYMNLKFERINRTSCMVFLYLIPWLLVRRDRETKLVFKINQNVYDLTEFIDKHPGGSGILNEWSGRDATVQFNIANHSSTGKALAVKYLLWSHERIMDKRRGYPAFLFDAVRKTNAVRKVIEFESDSSVDLDIAGIFASVTENTFD